MTRLGKRRGLCTCGAARMWDRSKACAHCGAKDARPATPADAVQDPFPTARVFFPDVLAPWEVPRHRFMRFDRDGQCIGVLALRGEIPVEIHIAAAHETYIRERFREFFEGSVPVRVTISDFFPLPLDDDK